MKASLTGGAWSLSSHRGVCAAPREPGTKDSSFSVHNYTGRSTYLRLVANPDDDVAFERVVNTPTRGIGERTLDLLREQAHEANVSLWQTALTLTTSGVLGSRAGAALCQFIELIQTQAAVSSESPLAEIVKRLIEITELPAFYQKNKDGKGQNRIENLEQLVETVARFEQDQSESEDDVLGRFLAHAALEAGDTQADHFEDSVQLMTLHSAKGLEFPLVFLVGLEDGLFPHSLSADDPAKLEEERRLCYVGMTRAMRQLVITHAEKRYLYGREDYPAPSRFLREIPPELVDEMRGGGIARRTAALVATPFKHQPAAGGFQVGQRVHHPKFGAGVILNHEGSGINARVQVNFKSEGAKWLVLAYARLESEVLLMMAL